MDVDMWMMYEDFVKERHRIWERRQAGEPSPWTKDPYLASKKFTNVFRVLDPGSQFVLTDLYDGVGDLQDYIYRVFLYRHTGRVEAWQWLPLANGRYPFAGEGESIVEAWNQYRGPGVYKLKGPWTPTNRGGFGYTEYKRTIFTGAYLVFPQSQVRGTNKMVSIVGLAERLHRNGVFTDFLVEKSPAARFRILQQEKGVGNFMAMQVLTDWGYLDRGHEENAFVVAGPGAVKGAAFLNPGVDPLTTIQQAQKLLWNMDDCPTLLGRRPSLMDTQNTLCEFSKLVRYLGSPPGRAYEPAHPGKQEPPVLPRHWNLKGTDR